MSDLNYNSLVEKLKQSGIIPNEEIEEKSSENIFERISEENETTSPFSNLETEIPQEFKKPHKRLNKSDIEMVSEDNNAQISDNSYKIIKRFLNFKQKLASKGSLNSIENFLFAFFPKLYKAKLVKDAMIKLKELNIDTQKLMEKTFPYGENEARYENLVKYINYANEIQTKINKEIN